MNRKTKELKRMARETLNNRYHLPMTAFFLSCLITILIEMPFSLSASNTPTLSQYIITYAAEFFISLIAVVLNAGETFIHMNLSRKKAATVGQLFFAFKQHPERYIGAGLLSMLITLGSSLPFIGGFVFSLYTSSDIAYIIVLLVSGLLSIVLNVYFLLTYGMVFYFLIDYPEMKVIRAFRESRLLMKGQKGRFLYLQLSFFGWYLLILLSFGVASLWIIPYQNQTLVKFYSDLTGELDRSQVNFTNATI